MAQPEKSRNDLASFYSAINEGAAKAHTPHFLIDENAILNILQEAVSGFGVESVLYISKNLLTFLEYEPVEGFAAPLSDLNILKQKATALETYLKTRTDPLIYADSLTELGYPIAANQDEAFQDNAFVTCIFHGKNSRSGRFLFHLKKDTPTLEDSALLTLQNYAQITFLKINTLITKRDKVVRLTPRESEMVKFIAKGRSNPEIAELTGLSVHTVNGYLRGIYLKTSTKDRVSLTLYALHKDLLF